MDPDAQTPYVTGRPVAKIERPYNGEDHTFAAQRLDRSEIRLARYRHCTFVNVSFKEALLKECVFDDCVFVGCYFRRARVRDCVFKGCRFYDCEFPRISLVGCRLFYVRFSGCQVPFRAMYNSLPPEPNLREELCRNLARQSSVLGLTDDARRYRRIENASRENHLKSGFLGESDWYRRHFVGVQRLRAFANWTWSKVNRLLWGYCESGTKLAANFMVSTIAVFPTLYWLLDDGDTLKESGDSAVPYVLLSLSAATPASFRDLGAVDTWPFLVSMSFQGLYSVVLIAMFAAFLFRWSSRQ